VSIGSQTYIVPCTTATVASKWVTSCNLPVKRNPVHFRQQRSLPVGFRNVDTTPCLQRHWSKVTDRPQSQWDVSVLTRASAGTHHGGWSQLVQEVNTVSDLGDICRTHLLMFQQADVVSRNWGLTTASTCYVLTLGMPTTYGLPTYLRQLCLPPITSQLTPFVAPAFTPSTYPSHCSDLCSIDGHTK